MRCVLLSSHSLGSRKVGGEKTVELSKKKEIIIIAAAIALVLVVAVPYVAFAAPAVSNDPVQGTKSLVGKGLAREVVDGQNVTVPANFTLTLERTGTNTTVPKFNVNGGAVTVDGTTYSITRGNGGVLRGRHAILLQAQGTGPDGKSVTLKLAGRYFWMGGHLFVVRMTGSLQTDGGKETLLMRAAIKV